MYFQHMSLMSVSPLLQVCHKLLILVWLDIATLLCKYYSPYLYILDSTEIAWQ